FMEHCFQKCAVALAGLFPLDLVNAPRRPRDDWWIYVAKVPFVGRNLTVGVLIPFAHDKIELRFGELSVNKREWNAMKRQVPRCVPGEFPFVWHRHDPLVVNIAPTGVATFKPVGRRWRLAGIAVQPLVDDVMIKLFVPKKSGERLALNRAMLF